MSILPFKVGAFLLAEACYCHFHCSGVMVSDDEACAAAVGDVAADLPAVLVFAVAVHPAVEDAAGFPLVAEDVVAAACSAAEDVAVDYPGDYRVFCR